MMDFKRKDLQTKRDFYRRMAQIRKNNWANDHKHCEDQHIKSHFMTNEDSSSIDQNKSKKIVKGELRTEQRLRNRVAAQQSRQRHRSYVEELQKKVKMYEEELDSKVALCRNCRRNLISELNDSETIIAQEMSDQISTENLMIPKVSQQQVLNSYLDNQIIRINNNDASTPFGIFFVVCLVAVLAVFSLGSSNADMAPRLLANYHSTVNQLISMEDSTLQSNKFASTSPKIVQISSMEHKDDQLSFDKAPSSGYLIPSAVEAGSLNSKNWTKYGDFICSQPSIILRNQSEKGKHSPQFLLLRSNRNPAKSLKKLKVTIDEKQGHRINIQSSEWQGVEISSCFRGD